MENSEQDALLYGYRYPWARIGSCWIDFLNQSGEIVETTTDFSRAFIKDFDLISASKRKGDEKLTTPSVEEIQETMAEVNISAESAFTPIEKSISLQPPRRNRRKGKKIRNNGDYSSFEIYWAYSERYLVYLTWLADYRDVMDKENIEEMERQIKRWKPDYLIDHHNRLLEKPKYIHLTRELKESSGDGATYEFLYEKHCEAVKKLAEVDFEDFRKTYISYKAKTFISKIERLGFTGGFAEEQFPTFKGNMLEEKSSADCVFDDLAYTINDSFAKPQYNYPVEEEKKDVETEEKDEKNETTKTEINFEFDPETEQHLIASKAGDLYKNDREICKYFYQRYRLFSKLDEGIIMDREGWFSVTPERIAEHIADRMVRQEGTVIVDAFAGVGGNAIQFALRGAYVIAIDLDPVRLKCARHNARVYGVENYISFICADYFHFAATWTTDSNRATPKVDGVFLSPPWGGPSYLNSVEFDLAKDCTPDGVDIFNASLKLSKNIAYFLPRNTKVSQLIELSSMTGGKCDIEQSSLNSKIKTLTAYYGDLAE